MAAITSRKPMPRKPPAKRLFSGMAGSPLARVEDNAQKPVQVTVAVMDAELTPAVETLPIPNKRGRKPINGVAMTVAERKDRSRTNQKTKQDDAQRRNLIARLVK